MLKYTIKYTCVFVINHQNPLRGLINHQNPLRGLDHSHSEIEFRERNRWPPIHQKKRHARSFYQYDMVILSAFISPGKESQAQRQTGKNGGSVLQAQRQ